MLDIRSMQNDIHCFLLSFFKFLFFSLSFIFVSPVILNNKSWLVCSSRFAHSNVHCSILFKIVCCCCLDPRGRKKLNLKRLKMGDLEWLNGFQCLVIVLLCLRCQSFALSSSFCQHRAWMVDYIRVLPTWKVAHNATRMNACCLIHAWNIKNMIYSFRRQGLNSFQFIGTHTEARIWSNFL